jgi:ubiquinol-cytochrome c reductase cytochrome b subunit
MITKRASRWLDSRLHLASFVRESLNHVFPDHWSFMLGEIALYCFIVLLITGTYLAMFFHASSQQLIYHGSYHALDGVKMSGAYQSALHLSFDVRAGLLIRQMHHWAADIFIWAIIAHLARIFFTAAYRKPREINWMIGLSLLILALVNGFLGYSILDDLLSGIGLRIGYSIALSIPVIGPWLAYMGLGGRIPNPMTIPRLYSMHIFLIPGLIAMLLALHLGIIWRQLHTNYPGPKRTNRTIVGSRLWPSYTAKSVGLLFLVFGVIAALGGLVQIDPVWINGPYNPASAMTAAQPDWYLGWVEGLMRLFPSVNLRIGPWLVPELFFPAVLIPSLIFMALFAYPFIEKIFSHDEGNQNVLRLPYQQPVGTALGSAMFAFMIVLLAAGGDDVIAVHTHSSVVTVRAILRILVFVIPAITGIVVYAICAQMQRKDLASRVALSEEAVLPEQAPDSESDILALLPGTDEQTPRSASSASSQDH